MKKIIFFTIALYTLIVVPMNPDNPKLPDVSSPKYNLIEWLKNYYKNRQYGTPTNTQQNTTDPQKHEEVNNSSDQHANPNFYDN